MTVASEGAKIIKNAITTLEQLRKENAKLREQIRWTCVEDGVPDKNTEVLLDFQGDDYRNMATGFVNDNGDWCIMTGGGFYSILGDNEDKPNGWRHLPPLPEEVQHCQTQ